MTASGRVLFLPWVTLPARIRAGGFEFIPVVISEIAALTGADIAPEAARAIRTHVDQSGKPITTATLVRRQRHDVRWAIPEVLMRPAWEAAKLLALGCLSEQRFLLGHFAPHMNSTMYRPISMSVTRGSDQIGLRYLRRGGALQVGGRTFSEVVFQQPAQIEGTESAPPNVRLIRALELARRGGSEVWGRISDSIDFFLMANSESPELSWESCAMLSAMAFDRLLKPAESKAHLLAEKFAELWPCSPTITVSTSKRVRPDNGKHKVAQMLWPVRRKWAKELYDLRSAHAHNGPRADLIASWAPWQHAVIAPFAYCMCDKLLLADAGFYTLSEDDEVARDVFDTLLDSDWGNGWKRPAEWPSILSTEKASRELRRIVETAIRNEGRK